MREGATSQELRGPPEATQDPDQSLRPPPVQLRAVQGSILHSVPRIPGRMTQPCLRVSLSVRLCVVVRVCVCASVCACMRVCVLTAGCAPWHCESSELSDAVNSFIPAAPGTSDQCVEVAPEFLRPCFSVLLSVSHCRQTTRRAHSSPTSLSLSPHLYLIFLPFGLTENHFFWRIYFSLHL